VGTPIDPGAGSGRTILVLGGTGQTGRELTRQALARGHGVHALVRSAERLGVVASRLAVTVGTPMSAANVRGAMDGCDTVLSALGIARTSAWPWAPLASPPDLMSTSIGNAVAGMRALGVQRIVVVSAGGVGDSVGDMPPMFGWLVRHTGIGAAYRGHDDQERILRESGLDWTALRPSMLRTTDRRGVVVLSYGGQPKPHPWISRSMLAALMLDALDDSALVGRAPTVSQA
jgi:uncharacterized protein YbjT (DUF2867 family)